MVNIPVATVDATGLHLPTYDEGLAYFEDSMRGIYGDDIVIEPATQDGQFLALLALALKAVNDGIAQTYNAFSPATAQGVGLSSVVKINGLARKIPTYSSVDLRIVGQAGSTLNNGIVSDDFGQRWILPSEVIILETGEVLVTAQAANPGAVNAPANTVNTFVTVERGFQSVTNPSPSALGAPVERDPELRQRQTVSTAIPAQTVLESIMASIFALPGVARARGYENDGIIPNDQGIPGHTLAIVVEGGQGNSIATVIAQKKAVGVGTYGSVAVTLDDAYGIPHKIRYFRPAYVDVAYYLNIRVFSGYTRDIEQSIKTKLATWTNQLGIGNRLAITRAYLPANLNGELGSESFELVTLKATRDGLEPLRAQDLELTFNEVFVCNPADVNIRIVS